MHHIILYCVVLYYHNNVNVNVNVNIDNNINYINFIILYFDRINEVSLTYANIMAYMLEIFSYLNLIQ